MWCTSGNVGQRRNNFGAIGGRVWEGGLLLPLLAVSQCQERGKTVVSEREIWGEAL